MNNQDHAVTIQPLDKYNQELLANVHPPDWANPTPVAEYDLVVIGRGDSGTRDGKRRSRSGYWAKSSYDRKKFDGRRLLKRRLCPFQMPDPFVPCRRRDERFFTLWSSAPRVRQNRFSCGYGKDASGKDGN